MSTEGAGITSDGGAVGLYTVVTLGHYAYCLHNIKLGVSSPPKWALPSLESRIIRTQHKEVEKLLLSRNLNKWRHFASIDRGGSFREH